MSVFVVDSSAAIKWFLDEEFTDCARRLLDSSHRLHGPELLHLEVDNLACKRMRRGEIDERGARSIREGIRQMPIEIHTNHAIAEPAFELALKTGRSLYDCIFLALAPSVDGTLVTADRRLIDGIQTTTWKKHVTWLGDLA